MFDIFGLQRFEFLQLMKLAIGPSKPNSEYQYCSIIQTDGVAYIPSAF